MSVLHSNSTFLSHHPSSRVAVAKQHAVVTVGDDGVACYDLRSSRRTEAIPLGSSIGLSLSSPAVIEEAIGLFYATLVNVNEGVEEAQPTSASQSTPSASTTQHYLVCWPSSKSSSSPSSRKKQPISAPSPPRTLADITPRIPLPGAAHSVHALQPSSLDQVAAPAAAADTQPHAPSDSLPPHAFAAVVLTDGRVGCCAGGSLELSMVHSPSLSPATGPLVDACAVGSMLLTLHHSSPHAMLRAYVARQTLSGPVLIHARDTPIPCPSHATPVSLRSASTYSLVVWSTGATTIVQLSTNPTSPGPAHPPKLLHFSPPPSITSAAATNGLLPAGATEPAHAGANRDTSSTPSASARKRKAPSTDGTPADAAGPTRPSPFLAAPLDDTQLIVACVCPAPSSTASVASHELQYAVLERHFGVVVHTGSLPLEGVLGALASQPRLLSHPEGSPGTLVLQASGSVFSFHFEAPPASLLSMVGRLAVTPSLSNTSSSSTTTTATPLAHPSQQLLLAPQQDATAETGGNNSSSRRPAPSTTLAPPPQAELDVGALTMTLQAKHAQQAVRIASMTTATPAGGVQGETAVPPSPEAAAGEYALQDLSSVQGELVHAIDATPLQLEQALTQARLKQQPPPLSTLQQAADTVAAAYHHHHYQQQQRQQQQQLQPSQLEGQEQQGYQVHQQQQPGHVGHSSVGSSSAKKAGMGGDGPLCSLLAASRLAPLVALACAEGERWEVLHGLLQAVPSHSLTGCSGVLLAVARGQQYQLLPLAACALEDVPPAELVQVVQALLAPTQATNLEARKAYHRQLRAAAEAEVQNAEQQLQGLTSGPSASGADGMAVDGEEQDEEELAARRRSALAHAHCAAAAVDGFALHEVLLHVPLALHADAAGLQACVRQLSNAQVDRLLTYLAKWVGKYSQGPLAQLAGSNAAFIATVPPALMFPLFSQVLDWLRVVIDGHLPRLLMAKRPPAALQGLQTALKSKVEACQQLLPLQGAIEHVRAGAPLPHAHVAASTMYTVEYVDLGLPVPA